MSDETLRAKVVQMAEQLRDEDFDREECRILLHQVLSRFDRVENELERMKTRLESLRGIAT